uniref:Uncharacterized protein n=1 Tax=Amphimedon queenslandica TaxID=400682 RepID=A0A1X7UQT5_AMPQE
MELKPSRLGRAKIALQLVLQPFISQKAASQFIYKLTLAIIIFLYCSVLRRGPPPPPPALSAARGPPPPVAGDEGPPPPPPALPRAGGQPL